MRISITNSTFSIPGVSSRRHGRSASKPLLLSRATTARMGAEFSSIIGNEIAGLSPKMVLAGMAIAIIFSLGAGQYPAVKATHLNPVEAIRE